MANEKDSITRKAKIEIDVQQSEKKLKDLNAQLKEVQKRLNEISRLKDRAFSTYSLSQQYRLSSSLGVSRSELSSMGSRDLTRLQANETQKLERIQSRLKSQELTHKKRILDLERSTQKVEEDRERTRKKRLSSLEKEARQTERLREINRKKIEDEKKYYAEADKLYANFVRDREERIRRESPKSSSASSAEAARRARQADLEYVFREKLDSISNKGLSGVVGGMFDPTLGDTVSARLRTMAANGVFRKAGRSSLQRFASQALWNMQGRIISTGYNTIRAGFESAPNMEEWLAETQAIAGATDGSMADLAQSIREVGANSRYTTEELTRTTTVLAQAGYSAEEISKLLGSVNRLAAATGTDLRTSVDLLTSSMSLWNAQSSDAERMLNSLTVAVNDSKAEINSIQKGMQYAGAAASQMGMSFEETVAAMSAVTNAGLKTRSIMGTGLRALLTELSNPAKKLERELKRVGLTVSDVNVRVQGFSNVMRNLAEAGFGAENAFRGMDRQAASFYLASKSQLDLYENLLVSMNRRGEAEKAEQTRMDTTIAQLNRFKNIWFQIGADVGGPINFAFKKTMAGINELSEVISKLTGAINKGLSAAFEKLDSKLEKSKNKLDSLKQTSSSFADDMWGVSSSRGVFMQRQGEDLEEYTQRIARAHEELSQKYDKEGKIVRNLSSSYEELISYIKELALLREEEERQALKSDLQLKKQNLNQISWEIARSSFGRGKQDKSNAALLGELFGINPRDYRHVDDYKKALDYRMSGVSNNELERRIYGIGGSNPQMRGLLEQILTARSSYGTTGFAFLRSLQQNSGEKFDRFVGIQKKAANVLWKTLPDFEEKIRNKNVSRSDLLELISTSSSLRSEMRSIKGEEDKLSGLARDTALKTQEELNNVIQQIDRAIENYVEGKIKDVEQEIKEAKRANRQKSAEEISDKIKAITSSLGENIEIFDALIDAMKKQNFDKDVLRSVIEARDKSFTERLNSQSNYAKTRANDVRDASNLAELNLKSIRTQMNHNPSEMARVRLEKTQASLAVEREILENLKKERNLYSAYSDQRFQSELVNPQEELVVKLQLDEQAALEEANRLGINGTGFWDQTGNSMGQGARDFFNNINQQSAAYSLTLEGLNSISSSLKNAFRSIATEGVKVSDAFRQMAQSILQSLANKAIDKGVDYMMFAVGQAFKSVGTGIGASGGVKTGGSGSFDYLFNNNKPITSILDIGRTTGAAGGLVTTQGIRRFATGGGVVGRDSVPALLMPGEYVMKKSAVDMLGKETLDSLNRATSRVSDEKASNIRESKSAKPVVTNVYVVSDAKEAGMTPNDVLVTIGRDILQGGQTRQLIQQVVQGRY
jgi:TP901 family phage tail tape measure protein